MGNNNKATYYQPIGKGEPPTGLKKKIKGMDASSRKKKIEKILADQPLKKEREKIGLTEKEKKKAVNIGKGKKAAKKTKKYVKKLGTSFKEGFVDTTKLAWEGAKKTGKKLGEIADVEKGFIREMVGLKKGGPIRKNKGGPIDARKIAKKYFKGTF